MSSSSARSELAKLEAAMADNPPRIIWEPNGRGVLVAVYVYDPHTDTAHKVNRSKRRNRARRKAA